MLGFLLGNEYYTLLSPLSAMLIGIYALINKKPNDHVTTSSYKGIIFGFITFLMFFIFFNLLSVYNYGRNEPLSFFLIMLSLTWLFDRTIISFEK